MFSNERESGVWVNEKLIREDKGLDERSALAVLRDLWPEGKFSNIQYEVEYLGKQMRAVLRLAADPDEGSVDTPRER